jgi:hypothetical protein
MAKKIEDFPMNSAAKTEPMHIIQNLAEVIQTIYQLHITCKKKAMRKNGLPTRLSGVGLGGIPKSLIENVLNGTGIPKLEAVRLREAINMLLAQILAEGGKPTDQFQIPETAIVAVA